MDAFFKTVARGMCKIFFVLCFVLCFVRPHLAPVLGVIMAASVFTFIAVGKPNRESK